MAETDPIVRLADVKRTIRWIRSVVGRYPGLQILLDRVPEEDDDFNVPSESGRRRRSNAAGDGPGLADEDDDEARAWSHLGGPFLNVRLGGFAGDGSAARWTGGVSLASGKKLPTRAKRNAARDELKAAFRDRAADLTDRLDAGDLDLDGFRRELRLAIKDLHTAGAVAGKGGAWADMSFRDWGRVGNQVQRQYQFADRFVDRIAASRDGTGKALTKAQIRANAELYGDAVSATFSAQEVAERGIDPAILGVQPGDGSTECRSRCKCEWKITVHSKERGDATARWSLGAAEHCRTCLARGRAWRSIKIRAGQLVEPLPGLAEAGPASRRRRR